MNDEAKSNKTRIRKPTNLTFAPDLHDRMKARAATLRMSLSEYLSRLAETDMDSGGSILIKPRQQKPINSPGTSADAEKRVVQQGLKAAVARAKEARKA